MFFPLDRLLRWYRAEDQEFFRRELRRTGRWLLRGGGAVWIAGYAALLVVQSFLVVNVKPTVTGYGTLLDAIRMTAQYSWVFALPALFAFLGWTHALQTRTFEPLAGERGRALALTELQSRQLWPAQLIAPVALRLAMAAVGALAGFVTFAHWLYAEGPPDPDASKPLWLFFKIYVVVMGLTLLALQSAAATAWAARWIHPGGRWERTALGALASFVVMYGLNAATIFMSQALVFQRWDRFFALNLRDPGLVVPYHLAFLPGVAFRLVIFGALFWLGVKGLRSRAATVTWRRRLELS